MNINDIITESQRKCPHCSGPVVEYSELMEKKDACYYKVKASAKVWPSAYASGRLVQCRKKGAANYGNKNESRGVAEGSNQPREAGKAIQNLKNLAVMKSALTMQQLSQAGREAIVSNAINAAKTLEQSYLANKQQGNAIFVRALRDEIDNFRRGSPINASFPESDNVSELGDLLQGKLGKVNFDQGVAEDFNAEYDDEAGMFKNDLQTIQRVSTHLEKAIYDNENLPEWCQAKIAQAKGMVVAVMDYMISQHENGIVDTVNEQFDLIEEMVLRLAEEHEVDADVIWEDFEAVDDDELYEAAAWQKKSGKNKNGGLNKKGVDSYRREHPGSKLQTAVTTKPSKLKPGSKAAKRRKSFCARMKGMKKHRTGAKTKRDPNSRINKSLRKWNC